MEHTDRMSGLTAVERRLLASSNLFKIAYWVPHARGDLRNASPFQGFAAGVLASSDLLIFASGLPKDFRELYAERRDILFSRAAGIIHSFVQPVMIEAFPAAVAESPFFINCVLSTGDVAGAVQGILASSGKDWLHIGPDRTVSNVSYGEVRPEHYVDHASNLVAKSDNSAIRRAFDEFLSAKLEELPPLYTDCPDFRHNITTPNDQVFRALHVKQRDVRPLLPNEESSYLGAAVKSAESIRLLRKQLMPVPNFYSVTHDLVIGLDSLTWPFLRGGIAKIAKEVGLTPAQRKVFRSLLARDGYWSKVGTSSEEEFKEAIGSPPLDVLVRTRSMEMRAFTAGLSLLGTAKLSATVRLNPRLNSLRSSLEQIANCARGGGPHQNFKLKKLVNILSARMEAEIGGPMLNTIRRTARRIGFASLITDLPLEWLQINGVPLGILQDVSRIPATPGNVMLSQVTSGGQIILGPTDFRTILVIRSFDKGDKIAKHLELALTSDHWSEVTEDMPNIRFVDVDTVDDFVDTLQDYEGAMLIFDGHGATDRDSGVGSIVIGGQRIDIWELRDRLKLPPIVLLSACDTYPVDGSHGSSAVAMLSLGAITVLGTLLPVRSVRSALFISRLMYRIASYMPLATRNQPLGIDWRSFMAGMLRMTYASELCEQFEHDFSQSFLESVRTKANMDINSRDEKWLDRLIRRLAAVVNKPVREIRAWHHQRMEFTDTLKYVQMGRPDLIALYESPPADLTR